LDDWEAYEQRQREREQIRARRRRRATRRRRLAAAVVVLAVLGSAGYAIAARTGGRHPVTAAGSTRPPSPPAGSQSSSAGPPSTAPPAKQRATGTVTLSAVGDTMLGSTPTLPPDPGTYLDGVRRQLRAQIVFGNLEGTLTDQTAGKCGAAPSATCFQFRVPPSYAAYLKRAGFTILSDANNHSYDFGPQGQADTVAALHRAGLAQTGLPNEITVLRVHGLRVAFVGFAPYSDTAPLNDPAVAAALIRRADRRADIVVVAIHAGAEGTGAQHLTGHTEYYVGEDRGNPEAFAHMAVDDGADLVLGSGPHVLRAMQIYHGRLIAYSMGNFAGYHDFALNGVLGISAILHVTLAADGRFRSGSITSLRLVGAGQPEIDPSGAGARVIGELSRADLGARGVRITPSGRIEP
jgi:poly-gamma-glutamate capsule biosynthesis protein CapA/YwtB (metallophosphatase superfamily)